MFTWLLEQTSQLFLFGLLLFMFFWECLHLHIVVAVPKIRGSWFSQTGHELGYPMVPVCFWKWPLRSFINPWKMMSFHSCVNVYQRVYGYIYIFGERLKDGPIDHSLNSSWPSSGFTRSQAKASNVAAQSLGPETRVVMEVMCQWIWWFP